MAKGRAVEIILNDAEKREFTTLTRKHGAPQALADRARTVLAAAGGLVNKIAEKILTCPHTVGTWRNRFAEHRMDGLYDEARPGAPREIGGDEIAAMVRKTLETLPKGATHWSLRTMATEMGHAPSTVHRIWRAFGLQPHRAERFKLSSDPLFVEKVRDIVGLYLSPPEHAIVPCVYEKSQVQALGHIAEPARQEYADNADAPAEARSFRRRPAGRRTAGGSSEPACGPTWPSETEAEVLPAADELVASSVSSSSKTIRLCDKGHLKFVSKQTCVVCGRGGIEIAQKQVKHLSLVTGEPGIEWFDLTAGQCSGARLQHHIVRNYLPQLVADREQDDAPSKQGPQTPRVLTGIMAGAR